MIKFKFTFVRNDSTCKDIFAGFLTITDAIRYALDMADGNCHKVIIQKEFFTGKVVILPLVAEIYPANYNLGIL